MHPPSPMPFDRARATGVAAHHPIARSGRPGDGRPAPDRGAATRHRSGLAHRSVQVLQAVTVAWFVACVGGQLLFAGYVGLFYGRSAIAGDLAGWTRVLTHGWVRGDTLGNATLAAHLAMAVVIVVSGALQLLPAVRARAPRLHRWNGRLYLASAALLGFGGLWMVWTRGTVGDLSMHLSISANAVLLLACAGMAWRTAVARQFSAHRRWALRLWLAASGVWFFRVGLMAWLLLHQRPVGFDPKTFSGPFLTVLGVAQFLLPLAVLELWWWVRAQGGSAARLALAGLLAVLTLVMVAGTVGAALGMWLPRL